MKTHFIIGHCKPIGINQVDTLISCDIDSKLQIRIDIDRGRFIPRTPNPRSSGNLAPLNFLEIHVFESGMYGRCFSTIGRQLCSNQSMSQECDSKGTTQFRGEKESMLTEDQGTTKAQGQCQIMHQRIKSLMRGIHTIPSMDVQDILHRGEKQRDPMAINQNNSGNGHILQLDFWVVLRPQLAIKPFTLDPSSENQRVKNTNLSQCMAQFNLVFTARLGQGMQVETNFIISPYRPLLIQKVQPILRAEELVSQRPQLLSILDTRHAKFQELVT